MAAIVILAAWLLAFSIARQKVNANKLFGYCGFRLEYDLPCPFCGMTRSVTAFAVGDFAESFNQQPAGLLLCVVLLCLEIIFLFVAISGKIPQLILVWYYQLKIRYIVLFAIVVFASGWAVTFARAMAAKQ